MLKQQPKSNPARPPRRLAYSQGGLDGLCGIYSTVNAMQYLNGKAFTEAAAIKIFKHLCGAIVDKFPSVLWEGTGVPELRAILDRADAIARRLHGFGIARSEPLLRRAPRRDDLYWARLDGLLQPQGRVLIVGLKLPWEHWSVLTHVTPRTLRFLDSLSIKLARRDDVSLRKGATYQIDPHQVFLLERVEPAA